MPFVLATPMGAMMVAVAVMLLVWAITYLLVRPLTQLLEHVPLVGGTIASAIGDVVGTVVNWALGWAEKAVDPLVQLVAAPINALVAFVTMLVQAVEAAGQAAITALSWAAGQVGTLADRIASLLAQVTGLSSLVHAAQALISSIQAAIANITAHVIPAAIDAVRDWVVARITAAIDAVRTALTGLVNAARTYALGLVNELSKALDVAIAAVRAFVLAAVAVAVKPLEGAIDALGRQLADIVGGILARLAALEKLLPLLGLIPLVGAIPIAIETFWRTKTECVDPTCNLLGDLLGGLGAAGELLSGTVLIGLVEESIRNPEGTAQEVAGWSDELRGLASEVTQVLAGRSI